MRLERRAWGRENGYGEVEEKGQSRKRRLVNWLVVGGYLPGGAFPACDPLGERSRALRGFTLGLRQFLKTRFRGVQGSSCRAGPSEGTAL